MRFLPILLGIAIATCATAADKGKKKRENRDGRSKITAAELDAFVPELASIAKAAPVAQNRELRLSAGDVQKVATAIDRVVYQKLKESGEGFNPKSDDASFVRRVYLSIIGRIPSVAETEAFLKDLAANKRAALIDRLLVSDGYRSHTFNWMADMLRVRSTIKRSNFALHQRWLKDQIALNRPWDKMVHEMLTADGSLATNGATGYLLRDAGMPLDGLANTVSLFLGANVACAQCHDHPLAEWTQREFYELAAFFGATDVSSRDPRKISKQLMTPEISKQELIRAVAPNMARVKSLPKQGLTFPDDYAYDDVKPGSRVHPTVLLWHDALAYDPKFASKAPEDLRRQFADWLTHKDNPRFAVAIANRLWGRALGIAAQEPLEDLDDLSLAENPKLLQILAKLTIVAHFDLREVQRVIYNTRAFQAEANVTPSDADRDDYLFSGPVLRRMTAEQAWDSTQMMAAGREVDAVRIDDSHMVTRFAFPFDETPEPFVRKTALAMKQAGHMSKDRRHKSESKKSTVRASEMAQPQRDNHFLRMFGQSTREVADDGSLEGNVPQTLSLMNGSIQRLLVDERSRFMKDLARKKGDAVIEHLYLQFYSRPPNAKEVALVRSSLRAGTDLDELVWVLFNTPEFLFIR